MRALYQRTGKLYVEKIFEVTPGSEGLQPHCGGAAKIPK
jgi:hypothetical protein